MIRVLLYGEVDLNLIDGSSIWLASLCELLAGANDIEVTVLQRTRIERDLVIRQIKGKPNVTLIDPWAMALADAQVKSALAGNKAPRLASATAGTLIRHLDQRNRYDAIIVRSIDTAALLGQDPGIASRLWPYMTDPLRHTSPEEKTKVSDIYEACGRFLCQTEEAGDRFRRLLDIGGPDKILILPPMVPALKDGPPQPLDPHAPRLGYSGKFSPPYLIMEMLDAFEKIRARAPGAEFHIVGDKFHNAPPVANFVEDVTRRLQSTDGVIWHGGVSRDEANRILEQVHVASSWRDTSFDTSLEMSTKILESSALGIPVLMNPSSIQYRIFGPNYPAYVQSENDFVEQFLKLTASPAYYLGVSNFVRDRARDYTFESILARLKPHLRGVDSQPIEVADKKRILFVGHDLKFLRPLLEHFENNPKYLTSRDEYTGHVIKDTARSEKLLEQADIIFCEWCLGNAEWYSHHVQDHQRLVIRFHRQEIETSFLERIQWERVHRIVFICQEIMDQFLNRFPTVLDRAVLIYNLVDCARFNMPKLPGAEFNLGLLGAAPRLKAPHLAFEIFKHLKKMDKRYTLFIKGKQPWEYPWLWRREEERQYYEEFYKQVNNSPYTNSVVFDPHGDDVPDWFSKIGFILSTSDYEGSHQAVAEGMAAGSIPVIRNWDGADEIYTAKYVFKTVDEAIALIQRWNTVENFISEGSTSKDYAKSNFDLCHILAKYDDLFVGNSLAN